MTDYKAKCAEKQATINSLRKRVHYLEGKESELNILTKNLAEKIVELENAYKYIKIIEMDNRKLMTTVNRAVVAVREVERKIPGSNHTVHDLKVILGMKHGA